MVCFCYVIGVDVIEIILYVATDVNVYDIVVIWSNQGYFWNLFGLIRVIFGILLLIQDNLVLLFCCIFFGLFGVIFVMVDLLDLVGIISYVLDAILVYVFDIVFLLVFLVYLG